MADILIKGIEMPKCCDECPMSQLINDNKYAYCNLLRKGTKAGYILKACPLVELPSHGRLIDADRLKGIIRKANEDCMFVGKYDRAKQWSDAEFYVDHAPTVLEASK